MILKIKKGEQKQLRPNFKASEFHCHCKNASCTETLIDDELLDRLQWMRDTAGKSIHVNSGFRCWKHNNSSAVGGSKTSKHPLGRAADVVIAGYTPKQMAQLAVRAGFRGVIRYSNRIHVDTREVTTPYYRDKGTKGYIPVKNKWDSKIECNPWPTPTVALRKGDKGLNVRWLQWELTAAGVRIAVDGSFGAKTEAAVRAFQEREKLEVDGHAGPKTRSKLREVLKK